MSPSCPVCGSHGKPVQNRNRVYRCTQCKTLFDDDVDDVDYYADPTRRIEKQEDQAEMEREKRRLRQLAAIEQRRLK